LLHLNPAPPKQLPTAVSNTFKLIHRQTENFHPVSKFDANYNKFLVIHNIDPVFTALNKINDISQPVSQSISQSLSQSASQSVSK
jgi:hypothetical protein